MTLNDIRTYIRLISLIEETNITDVQLSTLVNQGYYEVSVAAAWPWLETSVELSLTADVQTIDLPDNFDYGITLVDDDIDAPLEYMSSQKFFRTVGNDTGNSATNPQFFTIFDGAIYLSPTPDTSDSDRYTLYYYTQVSELVTDNDEPQFHQAYHWMLVEYVLWKLYNREEYFAQSERSFITYSRYLNDMKAWYGAPMKRAPFPAGDGRQRTVRQNNIPSLNDF